MRSRAWDTSTPMARRVAIRWSEGVSVSVAKKSMVPTTRPASSSGKQMPLRTPTRWAAGARTQSVTSPMSGTKTRSRARHARPDSPTPSVTDAAMVTRRNSSPASPDSCTKRSALPWSSIRQYEP